MFLGYRQGKPHRKYVTRRTRAEAAAEIRRLIEVQRQGQLVTTGGMTVGEWLGTYMEQVARPKVRPRTLDRYRSDIERHIIPAIGRYRLDKLRPAHLVALYNAKAAEGLSGASLPHMHAVIRRALNVAVRWQLLAVNPALLVDAPRAAQHEVIPLTAAEARQLIAAAAGDRMQARWLVGLALGLRRGEALGLWWEDIDLETWLLRIRRDYSASAAAAWSSPSPRPHGASAPSRYQPRWPPRSSSTGSGRTRNVLRPGRCGGAARACSLL